MNRHILRFVILALVVFLSAGCKSINDIRITSCGLVSLTPKGFRSADAVLALGIDNPVIAFNVSNLKGEIVRDDEVAATFSAGTVNVEGRTEKIYYIPCSASIDQRVSILELVSLAANQDFSAYRMNLELTVTTKSGVGKKLKFKDIAISDLIKK